MILTLDVGNYKTAFGLFDHDGNLVFRSSILTSAVKAVPVGRLLSETLEQSGHSSDEIRAVAMACVRPELTDSLSQYLDRTIGSPLVLNHLTAAGLIKINYNPPSALGPDRIANSIAARNFCGGPACVVDFGTATNFEVISSAGEFIGGAIAPGMGTAMEALFTKAQRLSSPGIKPPEKALADNTEASLLSGCILGHAAMTDGLLDRMEAESEDFKTVMATGGLAEYVVGYCRRQMEIRPNLTLEGLYLACTL